VSGLRNRISVTLSDVEMAEIEQVAELLGVKPTRVVYDCVKSGLSGLLDKSQGLATKIRDAKRQKSQVDWAEEAEKAEKPRTNAQRKQDKKKSR
jgi:hypothetical protein